MFGPVFSLSLSPPAYSILYDPTPAHRPIPRARLAQAAAPSSLPLCLGLAQHLNPPRFSLLHIWARSCTLKPSSCPTQSAAYNPSFLSFPTLPEMGCPAGPSAASHPPASFLIFSHYDHLSLSFSASAAAQSAII